MFSGCAVGRRACHQWIRGQDGPLLVSARGQWRSKWTRRRIELGTSPPLTEVSRALPDLFSRVLFSFWPPFLTTPLPPFSAPSRTFLPVEQGHSTELREWQFQDAPLKKVREGNSFRNPRENRSALGPKCRTSLEMSLGASGPGTPKSLQKSPGTLQKHSPNTFRRLSGDLPDCPRDFFETFWGPGAGGPGKHFRDFFGISGSEGPGDLCKGRAGSQELNVDLWRPFFCPAGCEICHQRRKNNVNINLAEFMDAFFLSCSLWLPSEEKNT